MQPESGGNPQRVSSFVSDIDRCLCADVAKIANLAGLENEVLEGRYGGQSDAAINLCTVALARDQPLDPESPVNTGLEAGEFADHGVVAAR